MNNHQFSKRWESIKEKGRFRYATTQGIKYGIFLTIFMNLMKLTRGLSMSEAFLRPTIIVEFVLFTLFGMLLFGTFMWWMNNYFYKKIKSNNP
jgi:hypothetical protein